VRELRHIHFNAGAEGVPAVERLLAKYDLGDAAKLHAGASILKGYCTVTLDAADPRVPLLVADVERLVDEHPLVRAERQYDDAELAAMPWLHLRVATAGLLGGVNLDQPYDAAASCRECGAGARVIPPVIADLARMGRKALDRTAHDGHVIVTDALATAIEQSDLSGVAFLPARRRSRQQSDSGFRALSIVNTWPPLSGSAHVDRGHRCPVCGRGGHADLPYGVTELRYEEPPQRAADWNCTWEYFGDYRGSGNPRATRVGGAPALIVSQRVRQLLLRQRVRHVLFEPIFFESASAS
jgi:hypothetical protein